MQIAGEAFNLVFPALKGDVKRNKTVENGFRTCGIWPLSLPAMLRRLESAKVNSVSDAVGTAEWLKTKEHARGEILTLPPKKAGKKAGRKRVSTELSWHTREDLRAASVQPAKRKK
jgi:hypothetical protein